MRKANGEYRRRIGRARALRLAAALLGLAAPGIARADSATGLSTPLSFEEEMGPWEFGVDWGVMYPVKKATFSHDIDNQRAYDLLANETVGDEVGEGWVAPPLPGNSTVAGTIRPLVDVGGHLYYQFTKWVAFGVDGGQGLQRDVRIDDRGIYQDPNFLHVSYDASVAHLDAPVKLGAWLGPVRPYLLAGPGVYYVHERAAISFTDSDDPQLQPLEIVRKDYYLFGAQAGAGIDVRVGPRGLLGLDVQYHKVVAGGSRLDFVLPKLRLSVKF